MDRISLQTLINNLAELPEELRKLQLVTIGTYNATVDGSTEHGYSFELGDPVHPKCIRIPMYKPRTTDVTIKVKLGTLNLGDILKIGMYDFIVLEQQKGQTVVISKDFMSKNIAFGDDKDYNTSRIRKWIEGNVQPIIEDAIGAENLVEHEADLTSVDMQNEYGICRCKVRLITFDEARKYKSLLVNENLDDYWWTCTPWGAAEHGWSDSVAIISPSGYISHRNYNVGSGVRPLCILKSNTLVSKVE